MLKDIERLLAVQEKDMTILAIQWDIEELPKRLAPLDQEVIEKEKKFESMKHSRQEIILKRKALEAQSEDKLQKIQKYEVQLTQVKTNQEYRALMDEIAHMKADNALVEDQILNVMELVDSTAQQMHAVESVLSEKKKERDLYAQQIAHEIDAIKKQLEVMQLQRQELTAAIHPSLLKMYEKILKNKNGKAVVELKDSICQGCNMRLPHNILVEVLHEKTIIQCENCARILYAIAPLDKNNGAA